MFWGVLTLLVAILSIVSVEMMAYVYIRLGGQGVVVSTTHMSIMSAPAILFDPVRGIRVTPGPSRVVRVSGGVISYDSIVPTNQQGWNSVQDYTFEKTRPGKRYAVLGDSFTASMYLTPSWPDRVGELLTSRQEAPAELYSFAVSGVGIANWHSIFRKEILPNYQIDGVILAIWGDNLQRRFTIAHSVVDRWILNNRAYLSRVESPPRDERDFLENFLPRSFQHPESRGFHMIAHIFPEWRIDRVLDSVKAGRHWEYDWTEMPGLKLIARGLISLKQKMVGRRSQSSEPSDAPASTAIDWALELRGHAGDKHAAMLLDILETCRLRGLEVIIAVVPDKDGLKNIIQDGGASGGHGLPRLIAKIAEANGLRYFDGFRALADMSVEDVDRHWLINDGHWNQLGSDRFARAFAAFLESDAKTGP